MTVHIHTAPWQPATRHFVPGLDTPFALKTHAVVVTNCCRRPRRAMNVEMQVYYDMTRTRCVIGKSCR